MTFVLCRGRHPFVGPDRHHHHCLPSLSFPADKIGPHCYSSLSNPHLACFGSFVLHHKRTRLIAIIRSSIKLVKASPRSYFRKQFTTRNQVTDFFKPRTEYSTNSSFPPQVTQTTTRVPQLSAALTFEAESSIKKMLQTLSVCAGPCALSVS